MLLPTLLNRFTVASLLPALLLGAGALWAGPFPLWAILAITAVALGFESLIGSPDDRGPKTSPWLSVFVGLVHLPLLGLCVWGLGQEHLGTAQKVLLVIGAGLYFGQISNSNAHELIHRRDRLGRLLGVWSYASLLNGHHDSAHRLVHHPFAATERDPNTARLGQGFWRFFVKAVRAEYMAGLKAEARLRKGRPVWHHPYLLHAAISAVSLAAAALLGGWIGVIGLLIIAGYAQIQLCLSDYVQHYGLMRQKLPDGSYESIGPAHAWNAPHWYSSAMMLNAPRHSDHHMKPGKTFDCLELDARTMPMLPYSLPVMAVLALVPPLWRGLMDARVRAVRAQRPQDPRRARHISRAMLVRVRGTGQRLGKLSDYQYATPHNRNLPLSSRAASLRPDERF